MKKLVCAVTVLAVSTAQASTIHVDDDAPLGGDGSSWGTAYKFLQDARAAAVAGDEIRLAQGVYKPDQDEAANVVPGDRQATFQLVSGVVLQGGFAGIGAKDPDERDIALYETILSGDLLGDDGPDFANNGENSYHVFTTSIAIGNTSVLDGLTITGGNANGTGLDNRGGGMLHRSQGTLSLVNVTFKGNSAALSAGGMDVCCGVVTLTDCVFCANTAQFGAGIFNDGEIVLTGCLFSENVASTSGGAISNFGLGRSSLTDCTLIGNVAITAGGAVHNQGFVRYSAFEVTSLVTGNRMIGGGTVFNQDGVAFTHGFELHCDPSVLPNALQINWAGGNRFNLTTLLTATCFNDPSIPGEGQPVAGFNTITGMGIGSVNGVPGYIIDFRFTDSGEPGTADIAEFTIVGVETVAENTLEQGDHQALP